MPTAFGTISPKIKTIIVDRITAIVGPISSFQISIASLVDTTDVNMLTKLLPTNIVDKASVKLSDIFEAALAFFEPSSTFFFNFILH